MLNIMIPPLIILEARMSMLGSLPGVVEVHVSMGEGKKPEDK